MHRLTSHHEHHEGPSNWRRKGRAQLSFTSAYPSQVSPCHQESSQQLTSCRGHHLRFRFHCWILLLPLLTPPHCCHQAFTPLQVVQLSLSRLLSTQLSWLRELFLLYTWSGGPSQPSSLLLPTYCDVSYLLRPQFFERWPRQLSSWSPQSSSFAF